MTKYECLLTEADNTNINIIEKYDLSGTRLKGLYCDGSVALSRNIESETERACILAEELGHYYTSTGNILDQCEVQNRKQEAHARMWAYNRLIGLHGIIDCYKAGCRSMYEMAEHLGVTEEFLSEALRDYRRRYGLCTKLDNYVVYFEPSLSVFELI